jgi:hypothetical protein
MLDKTRSDWVSLAEDLQIESRAFTNGQYKDALAGDTRETLGPGDGRKLADVANCGVEDADQAVKDARAARRSIRSTSRYHRHLRIVWPWCRDYRLASPPRSCRGIFHY